VIFPYSNDSYENYCGKSKRLLGVREGSSLSTPLQKPGVVLADICVRVTVGLYFYLDDFPEDGNKVS